MYEDPKVLLLLQTTVYCRVNSLTYDEYKDYCKRVNASAMGEEPYNCELLHLQELLSTSLASNVILKAQQSSKLST